MVASFLVLSVSALLGCHLEDLYTPGELAPSRNRTVTHKIRKSATIIVTLCLSVIFLIVLGIQQSFCLLTSFEHRLLPVQYFKSRTLILLFIQTAAGASPIFIPVYFIPLFFQFTKGDGPLDAAVRLLPFVVFLVFFSLANGAIMGKEGHYQPWFLAANSLIVIGSALMYTVDESTTNAKLYGYSIILATGSGCIIQIGFIVAQAIVPRSEMSSGKSQVPSLNYRC